MSEMIFRYQLTAARDDRGRIPGRTKMETGESGKIGGFTEVECQAAGKPGESGRGKKEGRICSRFNVSRVRINEDWKVWTWLDDRLVEEVCWEGIGPLGDCDCVLRDGWDVFSKHWHVFLPVPALDIRLG